MSDRIEEIRMNLNRFCRNAEQEDEIADLLQEIDRLTAELAEARESASKYHAELVDSLRVVADERDAARQERDAAIRERDARPDISREDAATHNAWLSHPFDVDEPVEMRNAVHRVDAALRAHAVGVDAPRVDPLRVEDICLPCCGLGVFHVPPRPYAAPERVECDACHGTGRTEAAKGE